MGVEWTERAGDQLGAEELYALLRLRSTVFVVEQECAYQDPDGLDLAPSTRHLWTTRDPAESHADTGAGIAAYARLLAPVGSRTEARIGRVIVDPSLRGRGLGRILMEHAVARCSALWPEVGIAVAAQAHLSALYASVGFVPTSEAYLDDGIPHVDMLRARA